MTDLIAKIRSAQIRAGEAVVIDHLRQVNEGLLRRATNQTDKPSPDTAAPGRQSYDLRPCPFCGDQMGQGKANQLTHIHARANRKIPTITAMPLPVSSISDHFGHWLFFSSSVIAILQAKAPAE